MNITEANYPEIYELPSRAAAYIEQHGWVKGEMENPKGSVCLTGALKECSPQPGDWLIARAVYRKRGHGEGWNDAPDRVERDVIEYLRHSPITDGDLDETFGPQWAAVVSLIRSVSALTPARGAARGAAWEAAWYAAGDAVAGAARESAWEAAWDAAWYAARGAAWEALRGLVVRDLIGQHGFTQDHYDTLTAPLASVIGPIHPDDKPSE